MRLIFNQLLGPAWPDLAIDSVFSRNVENRIKEIHTSQLLFVYRARVGLVRGEINELVVVDELSGEEYACSLDGMMDYKFWKTFEDTDMQYISEIMDWAGNGYDQNR